MRASAQQTHDLLSELPQLECELRQKYPILNALVTEGFVAPNEHEHQGDFPLLDHALRSLSILSSIEEDRPTTFPGATAAFEQVTTRWHRLDDAWKSAVRTALVFMDTSKGGTKAERAEWRRRGIDLSIHNYASAELLPKEFGDATTQLVRWHGMIGQYARGEVPWLMFKNIPQVDAMFVDAFVVLNVCDTAAVKDDLLGDALWAKFDLAISEWVEQSSPGELQMRGARFAGLRGGRGDVDEAIDVFERQTGAMSPTNRRTFMACFDAVSFWYCESALAGLTPASQLKAIACALGLAHRKNVANLDVGFHISFAPIAKMLSRKGAGYYTRLLEATFAKKSVDEVFTESFDANVMVGIDVRIDSQEALTFELRALEEADALVTLLKIYETKSSARFHTVLKMLCDLYGLRKDTFDRVANEADYLDHMNSARSDKARMLDFAVGGTIVEIGPGGGVVLDLISERFPKSDVVGVDISSEVIEALNARKQKERSSWRVVYGDAFELPELFPEGFDCVVFCSVLHEIYSYVEWEGARFQLEAVGAMLRAAFDGLRPGGRIVIRDGIAPSDDVRVLRFLDPQGPDFLRLFAEQFEGLQIAVDWLDETTAKLSHHHAMEFLYCYTWGPSSFPYEVREQYGVRTYDEYVAAIESWLPGATVLSLPSDARSYLQPGYKTGLAAKVVVMDGEFQPTELPDSNCLIVIEKPEN